MDSWAKNNMSNGSLYSRIKDNKKLILKTSKLGKEIISSTSFLDYNPRMNERIWFIAHNVIEKVKCPICGNNSKLNKNLEIAGCSKICSARKSAETMKKVDPSTGLSIYDTNSKKQSDTKNSLDIISGKKLSIISARKAAETMKKVDPGTGLSIYDSIKDSVKTTMTTVDIDTGLTLYDIRSQKIKKINEDTGLSISSMTSKKSAETMKKVDPDTGLSIYDSIKDKNSKIHYIKQLKNFKYNFNQFKLLTTEVDYIKSNDNLLKYSCNTCNSIRESYWPYIRCTTCFPYNKSIAENEVLEYCQSLSSNVLSGNRQIIKPLELDVYIPDHNFAIEYDGLFWHSSYSTDSENKDYHLNKTNLCNEQGIQLFHIFENEWIDLIKQKIWKSIIKNKLGKSSRIYARKTTVAQITSKDKKQFLIDNHLQGDCASSVNLGLYLDAELVSVMTFGKSRYDKKVDWELLRFCNQLETSVVGGAGKLLTAFRRENDGSIISYADKRRSTGGLYTQLGFEYSHDSTPNYWYFKYSKGSMELESRIKYQKHKLEKMLDIFNIELTESENMYANGYRKIYDCGNQVWIYKY